MTEVNCKPAARKSKNPQYVIEDRKLLMSTVELSTENVSSWKQVRYLLSKYAETRLFYT
jgi:hypothetical protein